MFLPFLKYLKIRRFRDNLYVSRIDQEVLVSFNNIFYPYSVILEIIVEIWVWRIFWRFFYAQSEKFEKFLEFLYTFVITCMSNVNCIFLWLWTDFVVFGKWEFVVNIMKSICWKFLDYAWVGRRNFFWYSVLIIWCFRWKYCN